jgi:ribonuclease P/MRP protein subunit RPP1
MIMGKLFSDLHVSPDVSNRSSSISEIINMASTLGFSYIGLSIFNRHNVDMIGDFKRMFNEHGIDMVSRVDLSPQNVNDLKSDLRFYRGKVEVISVFCSNIHVARFAARDSRVDILNFSFSNWKSNFFDVSEAKLAAKGNSTLEINIADMLRCSNTGERISTLRIMSENVRLALKYGVPVIVSSGAKNVFEMRDPRAMASIMTLFGVSEFDALQFVSSNPLILIERNRMKLSGEMVCKGVRLLGRVDESGKIEKK